MRHLRSLLAVLVVAGAVVACSGTTPPETLCEQECDRAVTCSTLVSSDMANCKAQCVKIQGFVCSNQSILDGCRSGCLAKPDCLSYAGCVCPPCAE
jgi:hypothetical protein